MNRRLHFPIWFLLLAAGSAVGSTSGVCFVYQALTTMGTDEEAKIIVAKVPVIASGPAENILIYISAPHQLPQRGSEIVEDSNLLSCLGISVTGEWVEKPEHYVATLDLSQMKPTDTYDLSDEEIVKAAVKCIRSTIDENGPRKTWKIRINARPQDGAKWHKYEADYRPQSRKR
jgi:hypothetical protein